MKTVRTVSLALLLLLFGCTIRDPKPAPAPAPDPYAAPLAMIAEGTTLVHDGDLVLRSGQEFTSQFIRNFNRKDKTYSHAGIVIFENGYPYVYHIVPGDENPTEKMRKDSLVRFAHPRKNAGFGIYRYNLANNELERFKQQILAYYRQEVRFDSTFNMKTDDRMYCSEMISKALGKATEGRVRIGMTKPTQGEISFFSRRLHFSDQYARQLHLVAIENLFLDPHCRMVKRFDFTSRP